MSVLIFAEQPTARLKYVLHYMFSHLVQLDWSICDDINYYSSYQGAKLNYSESVIGGIQVVPSGFLSSNGIAQINNPRFDKQSLSQHFYLFETQTSFDIFSAIFFFLSRYEEYGSSYKDHHGRFKVEASILRQNELLEIPIVDIWVNDFFDELVAKNPQLEITLPKYTYLSSVDLDNGYKYKGKRWKRTLGAMVKDLKKFKLATLSERLLTLIHLRKDDFDIYQWLIQQHLRQNIPIKFFVLNAKFGTFDRSLPQNGKALRALVKYIVSQGVDVGLHPSYASHKSSSIFKAELSGLLQMAGKAIDSSRQHYLKFSLPNTFELLEVNEVSHDYSMGFASQCGFRAGTARSFYFYNLSKEQSSNLLMHPSCIMEGTFKDYLKVSPNEALKKMKHLVDVVKASRGDMISIWHEAQLAQNSPWRAIYLELIAYAKA